MSFDDRIRNELEREAARVEPDIERQLGAVEARAARHRSVGGPTIVLAAAVVVAALILRTGTGPTQIGPGTDRSPGPGASGGPIASASPASAAPSQLAASAATYPEIAGTYDVVLDPADAAVARDTLGGTWTMRLEADGAVVLTAPSTFTAGAGLTGIAFSLQADRFRTNLFINDVCGTVGTYTWARSAGSLVLTALSDDCAIRRTLLATKPWTTRP